MWAGWTLKQSSSYVTRKQFACSLRCHLLVVSSNRLRDHLGSHRWCIEALYMIFGELLFCSTIGGFLAAKPHAFAQKIGGQWMNLGNCDTGTRLVAVRTTTSSRFDTLEAMRSVFAPPRPLQLFARACQGLDPHQTQLSSKE